MFYAHFDRDEIPTTRTLFGIALSDLASIAIAISSFLSLFVIFFQAKYMRKQTSILNKQTFSTNRIIQIEQRRDRMANKVVSWVLVDGVGTNGIEEHFQRWGVILFNGSDQPIYDITTQIKFCNNESSWQTLKYSPAYFPSAIRAKPPESDIRAPFVVANVTIYRDGLQVQHFDGRGLNSTYSSRQSLSTLGLNEFETLEFSAIITFRTADGFWWTRSEIGILDPLFPELQDPDLNPL